MALRDQMRSSATPFLRPGEQIQVVFGAQTASQWLAVLTGALVFLGMNRYRIFAVTRDRIVVLDAGKVSMKKARGIVTELPRGTQLGPGNGMWHRIAAGGESLRVHRRFFKDLQEADSAAIPA